MNIILWVLQIALCLKLVSVAYSHGLRMDQSKMQQGMDRMGVVARPLLIFSALCAFLSGIAVILPAAAGFSSWITPLAAALVALMMLLATGFHVACRGARSIVFGLILFALSAFVSYGRWFLAPL